MREQSGSKDLSWHPDRRNRSSPSRLWWRHRSDEELSGSLSRPWYAFCRPVTVQEYSWDWRRAWLSSSGVGLPWWLLWFWTSPGVVALLQIPSTRRHWHPEKILAIGLFVPGWDLAGCEAQHCWLHPGRVRIAPVLAALERPSCQEQECRGRHSMARLFRESDHREQCASRHYLAGCWTLSQERKGRIWAFCLSSWRQSGCKPACASCGRSADGSGAWTPSTPLSLGDDRR